jgi:DNA polymerase-1
MARQMYGDPAIDRGHVLRKRVKTVMYAKVYGAGIRKIAQSAGLPEAVVRATVASLDQTFAGLPRLQKGLEQVAWQRQHDEGVPYAVSCLTGRRQVAEKDKVYALLNRLIQGTAAEAFKLKLLELDAAGLGDYMVVPVHDEIVLDVPDDEVEDAVRTLRSVMNDDVMFNVPISASVSTGQRWGTKEEL